MVLDALDEVMKTDVDKLFEKLESESFESLINNTHELLPIHETLFRANIEL